MRQHLVRLPYKVVIRYCVLLWITGSSLQVNAQENKIRKWKDSLLIVKDSNRYAIILNNISFYYHRSNLDSCLLYAMKALEISVRRHHKEGQSYAYTNFANYHNVRRNYKLAIIYNYEALKLDEALKDSSGMAIDLGNLALAYKNDGNLKMADYYGHESMRLSDRFPERSDLDIDLCNYLIYNWNNTSRRDSVKWALERLRGLTAKAPYTQEWYYVKLFDILKQIKTQSFAETEKDLNILAEEAHRRDLPEIELSIYYCFARKLPRMGYVVDSIAYAEKAFALAKKGGDYNEMDTYVGMLYRHYLAAGNWRRVGIYGNAIRTLTVSAQAGVGKLPVVDYLSYFLKEQQRNELYIRNHLQRQAIIESGLQREGHRLLLIFIGVILVLLIVFAAIYTWSYFSMRNYARRLVVLNTDITDKNKRLQLNDEFKTRLLLLIAHDFRSPLNDILHIAASWKKSRHDRSRMLGSIGRVELASKRTLDSFDGILRWIRSQFSGYVYIPAIINIKRTMTTAIQYIQYDADEKKVQVILSVPIAVTVAANHEMLQFVNNNLLQEMLLHIRDEGTVTITAQQEAGTVRVIVEGFPVVTPQSVLRAPDLLQDDKLLLVTCREFIDRMDGTFHIRQKSHDNLMFIYALPQV
ncbi:MAG TPA: hypothetical protein VM802_24500 [Chitinophaga sp.]|uniref:sensor histidine kinase n=1 Tax=Chitinophaga sp. TaxID=1869181 RepID=UPI002CA0F0C7|nr:hypothetical protein [Chitinophaga sp.]HVI48051.1 hypothetical protein [Chitinophaga sp.]